jgi:hypothetical protein
MTKTIQKRLQAIILLGGLALATGQLEAQEQHRLQGSEVAVYNLAGQVEIVAGSGSEVVVEVRRGGSDASRIQLETMNVRGAEALVLRYPDDRVVYPEMGRSSNTQIRVRDDGTFFGGGDRPRGDQVRISGSGRGMEAWADLRISVPRGQRFALYLAVGESEMSGVDGNILIDTGSGPVRVTDGQGQVNVDTGSGRVWVDGFRGDVTVDTGSGSVELSQVEGQEVEVDTGSGSVSGSGVTAESFRVDTGSGGVEFGAVSAPDIYVDTGSGRVRLELRSDVDRLVVDTGSGGVVLRVPSSLGAEVEIDTGSGGIDMEAAVEVRTVRRNYLRGVMGDGRGTIRIDTGSGGVRITGG